MRLSVVVVNWNSAQDLRGCLTSLRAQTHPDLEVVVVDNGSTDGSADMVAEHFPECRLLRETENLGFAEACNRGIAVTTGEWVAMLNNDTVADPGWAAALVEAAATAPPSLGMLQSLVLFQARPDTINSTGIELTYSGGGRDRRGGERYVPPSGEETIFCPTGAAAAYRRTMLEAVRLPSGYFDRSHFMYYEDMDLGWRARLAGFSALYVPASRVYHEWHGSSGRHGKSWLVVIGSTNRIRTLLKNASVQFLLRTSPRTVKELVEIAWHGRLKALRALRAAVRESMLARPRVTEMAKVDRRAVEREWTADPA